MEIKQSKLRRITLDLPEELVRDIKIEAAVSQLTLRQVCMAAIICHLGNKNKEKYDKRIISKII